MEELPLDQNIFPSDISDNNYNEYDLNNIQELDYDIGNPSIDQEIIKTKDKTIKHLKRKIKAYEKNNEDQNLKLSDYDHLLVEYNSLKKNYSQLEQDFELLRNENIQLKEVINSKNQSIIDFRGLFEASKSKFDLFNQTNNTLKQKISELESKLKLYPNIAKNNDELNQRMAEYESKIDEIKEEFNKREELYKVKLNNQEKLNRSTAKANEEEINDLKNEILRLKNQLDLLRKKNEEILSSKKLSEQQFNDQLINKDRENEKLIKIINNLKSNMNDNSIMSKTEVNNQKSELQKLKEEIKNLYKDLSDKEEQNISLEEALTRAINANNQSEIEIETRNNTISGLMEEKEQLIKQLNERQIDFNEYQNSSQQEIELLKQKLMSIEEERENLINENNKQNDDINQLKEELIQYEANGNIYLEERKENDNKFNNLAQAFQIKEEEYSDEIEKLKKINIKLQKELENLKGKYEKKINLLTLQNNESSLRVRKLINTCITLKDYALTIERNLNMNKNNINMNNSMFISDPRFALNYQNNNDLLSGMHNIVNQIDSKILNNDIFNQTY